MTAQAKADWTLDYICMGCRETITAALQPAQCPHCGAVGAARDFPTSETVKIGIDNDLFRHGLIHGMPAAMKGQVVTTVGVNAEGRGFITEAIIAICNFRGFCEDNDAYGARDFAALTVRGKRLYFKIDLYDTELVYGSPDPTDLAQTRRVLTIMFPSEY